MTPLYTTDPTGNVHARPRTPVEQRALSLHAARVYLREAQARAGTPFAATLLRWAGNARREAAAIRVGQGELFG